MQYNTVIMSLLLTIIGCTACSQEDLDNTSPTGMRAEVIATIGTAPVETKANLRSDDGISYNTFASGDAIGFFSTGGLKADNMKLTHGSGSAFSSEDLKWTDGPATNVFAYYPYTEVTPSEGSTEIGIWRNESTESGKTWKAGYDDLLTSSTSSVTNGTAVSLGFKHAFAMLIIKRGEGFSKATATEIKVELDKPFTQKATINSSRTITIGIDELAAASCPEITANLDAATPTAGYLIVPVGSSNTSVKRTFAITLHNDANRAVTANYTFNELKSNYKYQLTVIMRDDQIIIEPDEIRQWADEEIIITEPKGIQTEEHFKTWLASYNAEVGPGEMFADEAAKLTALSPYGDYDETNEKWTFCLLGSFSSTWNDGGYSNAVITTFGEGDTFDGQGHTISGLKLQNGFFATLYGTVKNLKLENIYVDGTENVGAIAGSVGSQATIENCHVKGYSLVKGTDYVGGLVGKYESGATIKNCTSSAIISGTGTNVNLLIGNGDIYGTNCSTTGEATVITGQTNP